MARAVANETGAFFFLNNGPEIMSKLRPYETKPAARRSNGYLFKWLINHSWPWTLN